jgi:hypothetical protein
MNLSKQWRYAAYNPKFSLLSDMPQTIRTGKATPNSREWRNAFVNFPSLIAPHRRIDNGAGTVMSPNKR